MVFSLGFHVGISETNFQKLCNYLKVKQKLTKKEVKEKC